jgi:hypothetical protein
MIPHNLTCDRRSFVKRSGLFATGVSAMGLFPLSIQADEKTAEENIHIVGPKEGYSPQVGTLVSMMNWMRMVVLMSVNNMSVKDLDYLHDPKSNTIGAMLFHLAATEVYYQANTFDGRKNFNDKESNKFGVAMSLGEEGRKQIKGHEIQYYVDILKSTRERTLQEFKKRDDKWLMTVDPGFFMNQPTNNYCKWFHVCEHESNHNGQIKWIKSRIPGSKATND